MGIAVGSLGHIRELLDQIKGITRGHP